NGKTYYKYGTYTCTFTAFSSNYYKDIPEVGTLTITVSKADLPDAMKNDMLLVLQNGREIVVAGVTEEQGQAVINEARRIYNVFMNKYGMFFDEVTASATTESFSGMQVMSDDSWGWNFRKHGMITKIDFGLYDMDCAFFSIASTIHAKWTITDDISLDEVRALFTDTVSLSTTGNVEQTVTNFVNGIKTLHPDYVFTSTLYRNGTLFTSSDKETHGGTTYYKCGTYTCVFTDFSSKYYMNVPEAGTLTINVSKMDLPDDVKAVFTNATTLLTTDNVEQAFTDTVNRIKTAHPELDFNYTLYKDGAVLSNSHKVVFENKTYYRQGRYTCVVTGLLTDFYNEAPNSGTITVNVNKATLSDAMRSDMLSISQNGRNITVA
ncbi:MAG: immunoglobulin domain-containing protein, partial [Clostridia bacterium]|nr:immunoglobulin domain-containing protein [Clostridia bacterium]